MAKNILVERDSRGVARVTLHRPGVRNALSQDLCAELTQVATDLNGDSGIRVVTITGSGTKSFCAGADLKERKGVSASATKPYIDAIRTAVNTWANMDKVTLAIINGYALGGGMELALACDIRIAAIQAQFGLTEVRLGIIPGAGGTQRLPRIVGVGVAKQLILLGQKISAEHAYRIGLVSGVYQENELLFEADRYVEELLCGAPVAIAKAKAAIDRGMDQSLERGLITEQRAYDEALFTEDRNEGLQAFAERRAPKFTGK